ncbi:MAG: type II CAAX endopeptidase family protein [Solirubrobacterales bacterium]
MNDDLSAAGPPPRYLPEFPIAGPPPVTPPPPGTPPPGELEQQGEPADRWTWWQAALAFFGGFFVSQVMVLLLGALWMLVSGMKFDALNDDSSFILVASALNELVFIAAAFWIARMTGPASLRDFGLRRSRFWPTVGKMAIVLFAYFLMLAIYNAIVNLAPDDAPDKLGAGDSNTHMLFFALLVAVLAPIAEEFFFRGFVFRALRNAMGVVAAAIVSGLLFGAMHIDSTSTDRLLQVIPLAVLGVSFALLYNWSGTLYAPIALHATNNAIAVAAYADKHNSDFGMVLAVVIWLGMMAFCALGWRFTDRAEEPPPPGISGTGGGPVEYALPR